MAEPASLDPFTLLRDLVSQVEKGVNEFSKQGMQSDEFAQRMNQALAASMATKKLAKELMRRSFKALNIPTRADILALGEQLQSIEDRMISMSATLDRLAGNKPAANAGIPLPTPSRTRRPPPPAAAAPAPAVAAPVSPRKRSKARR